MQHARATAQYNVYLGRGRDRFDVRGRVAHESLFNPVNGTYRGPSTQQGYSPFTTWTRGLAWAMLGFAEQLEFLETLPHATSSHAAGTKPSTRFCSTRPARRAISTSTTRPRRTASRTGIPAPPVLARSAIGARGRRIRSTHEPVDSSAAAIAAQGLLRLGHLLATRGLRPEARRYEQAGLQVAATLFDETGPYLSRDPDHQGLVLHSVYHWPNGWDHVPRGGRPREVNRVSGATITRASSRCTSNGSPTAGRTWRSSGRGPPDTDGADSRGRDTGPARRRA